MSAQQPQPQILEIYRDFLKPGSEAEFRKVEEDAARICRYLNCPHPYLALETLAGPKEVWWLNGYESEAEVKQVAAAYTANAPLMAALNHILERKKSLILEPVEVFANYRADLSRGAAWSLGAGRFAVNLYLRRAPILEHAGEGVGVGGSGILAKQLAMNY